VKAKVIEKKHEFFGSTFEVAYLAYDKIAGNDLINKDIIAAGLDEVEFIFDAEWEKEIIYNSEVLNIKKPKKASYYMYYAIIKSIIEHTGEAIRDLIILDDNEMDSKKVWIKKIKASANEKPIIINITGQNYNNVFEIKITDMDRDEFIKDCEDEINKLKIGLDLYAKRINGLMYTISSLKGEKVYTGTPELSLTGA
jgi:hypothetical protein